MTPLKNNPRKGNRVRRAVVAGAVALTLLAGGATAWALDRFVVQHVKISDVSAYQASQTGTNESTTADTTTDSTAVTTDTSYVSESSNINISTVSTGSGDSTVTYYVADVVLNDATTLQSAFANNGDYYGFRDTGIVIRNGVVFRDDGARQGLAFYRDGTVKVYDETATTAEQLLADGVWNTLSFGPFLLDDGGVAEGIEDVEVDTNFGNHSIGLGRSTGG